MPPSIAAAFRLQAPSDQAQAQIVAARFRFRGQQSDAPPPETTVLGVTADLHRHMRLKSKEITLFRSRFRRPTLATPTSRLRRSVKRKISSRDGWCSSAPRLPPKEAIARDETEDEVRPALWCRAIVSVHDADAIAPNACIDLAMVPGSLLRPERVHPQWNGSPQLYRSCSADH